MNYETQVHLAQNRRSRSPGVFTETSQEFLPNLLQNHNSQPSTLSEKFYYAQRDLFSFPYESYWKVQSSHHLKAMGMKPSFMDMQCGQPRLLGLGESRTTSL